MSVFDDIILTNIDDVFNVPSSKGRFLEMTNRIDYGLSFCLSGQITYEQNGVKTISDKEHAVILPQGGSYTLTGNCAGVFPLINFRTAKPFSESFISVRLHNPESYIKKTEQLRNFVISGNRTRAFATFYSILDNLKNEISEISRIAPAIEYIHTHISDENISNGSIAETLNISEIYLRRIFAKELGTTPHKYVTELRIERAKQLLEDSCTTITEIAEQSGFSSVYRFCKVFKEQTGITPTQHRKEIEKRKL